ncbi:MAG TPA: hypothetical protein PK156_22675, partial [Polyangium sp.]|nr:hypothetical protein [Polyangium sp.]
QTLQNITVKWSKVQWSKEESNKAHRGTSAYLSVRGAGARAAWVRDWGNGVGVRPKIIAGHKEYIDGA